VVKAKYGGNVNAGDALTVDADGDLVAATYGTDTTRYVIAQALENGANGEVRFVLVGVPHRAS
jgi:acyl-CoA reductase-like NAD-dependent aldehyde dehydrogenase